MNQRRRSVRMQPDADDGDAPGRPQEQLWRELASEDGGRLHDRHSGRIDPLEGIAEMEDQLRAAIGQHLLRLGLGGRLPFQEPDAVDHRGQLGTGESSR